MNDTLTAEAEQTTEVENTEVATVEPQGPRRSPWSRYGTDLAGVVKGEATHKMTTAEALHSAGLDFAVEKRPLYRHVAGGDGDGYQQITDRFELTRTDTGDPLSIVSAQYKPFQNAEAFSFVDDIVGRDEAVFTSVLENRGGKEIVLVAQLPDEIRAAGDPHQMNIIFKTSHDGSSRIAGCATPVRIWCTNALRLATNAAVSQWGFTHTGDLEGKLKQAMASLDLTRKYAVNFAKKADALALVKVSDDWAVNMLTQVLPERKSTEQEIDKIMDLYRVGENIGDHRNTGWGLVNAFSEFEEHYRQTRSRQADFQRILFGKEIRLRDELAGRLLEHAG